MSVTLSSPNTTVWLPLPIAEFPITVSLVVPPAVVVYSPKKVPESVLPPLPA